MTRNLNRNESVGTVTSVSTTSTSGSVGRKRPPVFPQKLYDMLENAEREGYSHIISWMPDGKSFKIHVDPTSSSEKNEEDEEAIVAILKKTFNQTRYKSFLRQIQLYGFQRVYKGPQKGECSHELFVRGQRDLLYRKSIEDFQNVANTSIEARSSSKSPKRTVQRTSMPPPPARLLREVTPIESLSKSGGESEFVWPRPLLCSSGPVPETIGSTDTDSAWPFQQFGCSSKRGSQCNYLATSEIPTKLINLDVTDSDEDENGAKSKFGSADMWKRRSSSILSLALSEEDQGEIGIKLEPRHASCRSSITSRGSERRRSSMSVLSLAMSEDFGLELEQSISKLGNMSLGLDAPMTAEFKSELERFVAEDCDDDDAAADFVPPFKCDASIRRDAATHAQVLPQAA